MDENERDSLRDLMQSIPMAEPPSHLKGRILNSIQTEEENQEHWILKPALVLASFIVVSVLGMLTSIYFAPKVIESDQKSAIIQWTENRTGWEV